MKRKTGTSRDASPIIGLVVVAHGPLAAALLAATEHVVGPQQNARAVAIEPSDDLAVRQSDIARIVREVDSGAGVVVVTDMFGGTPANLAHAALNAPGVEVVYGVNLPLLVKLAKMRDRPLAEAVEVALETGRKYINSAAAILETAKPR